MLTTNHGDAVHPLPEVLLGASKASTFPLHQRIRLVPMIQDLVDMSSLEKFGCAIGKMDGAASMKLGYLLPSQ
jgi:hypothetical protein